MKPTQTILENLKKSVNSCEIILDNEQYDFISDPEYHEVDQLIQEGIRILRVSVSKAFEITRKLPNNQKQKS